LDAAQFPYDRGNAADRLRTTEAAPERSVHRWPGLVYGRGASGIVLLMINLAQQAGGQRSLA
jgi:hypothetical protein